MSDDSTASPLSGPVTTPSRFRQVLFRVLAVQVLSLLALWLLQTRYDR